MFFIFSFHFDSWQLNKNLILAYVIAYAIAYAINKESIFIISHLPLPTTHFHFYYLTFPVDEEYSSEDARIIKDAFNYFIKEQLPNDINNLTLFNLSFIPPINNKPSIIIGKDNEGAYEKIYKKLADEFKNNVDIIIDENLFSNGRLYIDLKDITKDMNVMVINVILTTNLIDNKNLIIKFINLFQ